MALAFTILRVAAVLSGSSAGLRLVRLYRASRSRRGATRNISVDSRWCRGNRLARFVSAFLVVPGAFVVGLGRLIEAGEQAVFRQFESVFDDERSVGVVN